jgi:hypothetical protein
MQTPQQEAGGTDRRRGKEEDEEERVVLATWDCGSPLYDSFELASLHHVLERHLMVLPFPGAAAVSRSRRFDNPGAIAGPDAIDRGLARPRKARTGRRAGWTAAVFRAVTCSMRQVRV